MTTQTPRSIGLIGAGLMGSGIAASLLRHGHRLGILEHEGNQPLEPLEAAGAKRYASLETLTRNSDVIILCVTGTPQIEAILLGDQGVLSFLKAGTYVIDCSTAIPTSTQRIAGAVEAAGGRFLDAAMTRTPPEAAEGRLNLIVGGAPEDFNACLSIMQAYAENIVHAGPAGAGHQLKLLHNYVSLGFAAVLAEAAACARRAGTDPELFCEVLATGGGNGVVLDRMRPYIQAGEVANFRFSVANAFKDLDYYCSMAESMGGHHGVADAIRTLYRQATESGLAQAPLPELVAHLSPPVPDTGQGEAHDRTPTLP